MTTNFRVYGNSPFSVVVVHGGPGAPGEMKPVAEELSKVRGVIEPLQTADSVTGQLEELKKVVEENTTIPVYLIGWSWGAWLSFLFSSQYPNLVKKLILISSGPFESSYTKEIMSTRLKRLSSHEQKRTKEIMQLLQNGKVDDVAFNEFGVLMDKADSYDPLPHKSEYIENIEAQSEIYEKVWSEASKLRESGLLLEYGEKITCDVIAVHGDYDPHPSEGVEKPLLKLLKNFRSYKLEHCGHHPWLEKEARNKFYEIVNQELTF